VQQRKSAAPGDLNAISETDPDADQSSSATTSSATSSSSRHLLPKADPIDPSLISTLTNKIQMLSLPLQNYLPHLDLLYVSIITDEQRVSQSLAAIMSELSASKEEKEVIHKLVTESTNIYLFFAVAPMFLTFKPRFIINGNSHSTACGSVLASIHGQLYPHVISSSLATLFLLLRHPLRNEANFRYSKPTGSACCGIWRPHGGQNARRICSRLLEDVLCSP
jgi:hypothetical protein